MLPWQWQTSVGQSQASVSTLRSLRDQGAPGLPFTVLGPALVIFIDEALPLPPFTLGLLHALPLGPGPLHHSPVREGLVTLYYAITGEENCKRWDLNNRSLHFKAYAPALSQASLCW